MGARSFSHTDGGGGLKRFASFKRGGGHEKFYPVLRGGHKMFWTLDYPMCSPSSP